MKQILAIALSFSSFLSFAQLTPRLSPIAKLEQKIGFTDVNIAYSRPNKNNREIFGALVPFDEVWRTGANENTTFTCSDVLIFGKDTLIAGKYSLYTKPGKEMWAVYFYKTTDNWGNPEKWEESLIVLSLTAKAESTVNSLETFLIDFQNLETSSASLVLAWDKVRIAIPFKVATEAKIKANITKTMAGPTASEMNTSANYYFENKMDLKKALEWSTKAVELRPEAYWMYLTKCKIQAELGDKKAAAETAKKGKEIAEKENDSEYAGMFNAYLGNKK